MKETQKLLISTLAMVEWVYYNLSLPKNTFRKILERIQKAKMKDSKKQRIAGGLEMEVKFEERKVRW